MMTPKALAQLRRDDTLAQQPLAFLERWLADTTPQLELFE